MEVREPSAKYLTEVQRTELGEFPADWQVVPLGSFDPFITSGSRGWAAYYADIGSTFLRITNLSRSRIYPSLTDLRYVAVPPENSEGVRTALKAGDLLISITADIGIVGLVTEEIELPAYINQHIALVRFAATDLNGRYLAYFLAGAAAQRRFKSMTDAGAKAGMNLAGVREVLAALPPSTNEQAAIASALTDADALIDSLEQLLTKKRQIKQGAMQELLTGKRRLCHAADWHELRLGDVASLKARIGWQGLTTAEYRERGDHLLVTGTEFLAGRIDWDSCHYVDQDRYAQDKNIQLAPDDVLVTKDGTIGKAALIETLPMPATLNSGVFVIRPRNQAFHPGFFYYLLVSTVFSSFLSQLSAGSTINHLYQKDFVHFKFRAPQDIEEQRAVFEVLKAIDSDIEILESRLTKARALKQAMAQALLTGRIRLVEKQGVKA